LEQDLGIFLMCYKKTIYIFPFRKLHRADSGTLAQLPQHPRMMEHCFAARFITIQHQDQLVQR
jgi:hypothetical protein